MRCAEGSEHPSRESSRDAPPLFVIGPIEGDRLRPMNRLASRRSFVRGGIAAALTTRHQPTTAQPVSPAFSMPIGLPGQVLGDGFLMRHGFACENTWFNPGWLHTAEDFYAPDGNAGGAGVYSVADGEIVYAGGEYPGLVVIVQHAEDLYSVYGHLDYALAVEHGTVERGQLLGTVLYQNDGLSQSHLHFELRTFLIKSEVNGDAPRYSVGCSFQCTPGPGYWPIDAPEHPSAMGWRNPTHVIANRAYDRAPHDDAEVIVASASGEFADLWSEPPDRADAERVGELSLNAGDRYRLHAIATGQEAPRETSADGYRLWYNIAVPNLGPVWVQAAIPTLQETGSDGRPSSVRFDFLLAVAAD
jgi:murein DD-endopeptidase MepM/ murein hydrolase activator NlpD